MLLQDTDRAEKLLAKAHDKLKKTKMKVGAAQDKLANASEAKQRGAAERLKIAQVRLVLLPSQS